MNMRFVCVLAAFLLLASVVLGGDPCDGSHTNGCTTIFKKFPYKTTFRPACTRHDVCYACATVYGKSKTHCDNVFDSKMKTICKGGWFCNSFRKFYVSMVRVFGSFYFKKKPSSYCNQPWVKNCV